MAARFVATRTILNPLIFALIAGLDSLGTSIAFAALIFSGPLASAFGAGVTVMLLSCVILAVGVAWRSGCPTSLAQVQEANIGVLATAAAAAVAAIGHAPEGTKIATVFALLSIGSLGTGLLCYLSGRFRFGVLVRFLPYSVVAGFLAGSGWLLVQGAVMMISGASDAAGLIRALHDPAATTMLGCTLGFALALGLSLRLSSNPLLATAILFAAIALFYAALAAAGLSPADARRLNWLPAAAGSSGSIALSPLHMVEQVDWSAILRALPLLATLPLITIAGLLLNAGGLEAATGRDIDPNRELKVAGAANLAVGLIGGAPGFTGLSMTLLAGRLAARGRSAGIATALVLCLALPFAVELACAVPLFVAAGLMLMLGCELLHDWALAVRKNLPPLEWAVVLAIVLCVVVFGFVTGIALGLVFAIVTFVYTYARLPVLRLEASGRDRRSSTERSPAANAILDRHGHLIQVIELQGYLFFGTVDQVVRAIRRRIEATDPPRCLILDFRNVSGMDSAAAAGFVKIFRRFAAAEVALVLSPAGPDVARIADEARDRDAAPATPVTVERDLDHALEAAEDRLLASFGETGQRKDIAAHLLRELGPHPRLSALVSEMERIALGAGETLIRAGERASDIYILASGRVKVQITLGTGRTMRLRSMTAGAVLGEVAFYLGGTRTADVIIEEDAVLFRLTGETLRRLEAEDATLAVLAHRLFAATLAERLSLANRMVQIMGA
ncbi:SulP family inorganic anion transporter [Breoghania sp. JC706]|uniref:SulP family inorganic anion transporter n=1 Tax=Breoghania sp. JC706 TaxID=3117732 RepID=UPI00300B9DD5